MTAPVFGLKVAIRRYRCQNCGQEKKISTNHTGTCFDYCEGCSWKPSWGNGPSMPFNGRTYRQFEYAGDGSQTE